MRFRTRRHGAWFLALTAALSGCAPLTNLPAPPQGPLPEPGSATPPSSGPVAAPAMPTPDLGQAPPAVTPPADAYQTPVIAEPEVVEKSPTKRKGKRQAEDDTKDSEKDFDDFFKFEGGDD